MKTIFITGATENTGYAIASHFAGSGYNVAISSRDLNRAQNAAQEIEQKYSVKSKGYSLDLTDTDEIESVFSEIAKDFETLDIFVANSANLGIGYDIFNTSPSDFDSIMDVNINRSCKRGQTFKPA